MMTAPTANSSKIKVLFPGFSYVKDNIMEANCTCTLIKGSINCIIDTMTSWDGPKIVEALKQNGLSPEDINYVICTHGHSDHIGCNYLFQNAIHIVGFNVSTREKYFLQTDFSQGDTFNIFEGCSVIPTPGHTLQDVTVIFKNSEGVYAITGDLFEKKEDLENESIWIAAGSDSEELQRINRQKILEMANFIIPGHGPMFAVPDHWNKNKLPD